MSINDKPSLPVFHGDKDRSQYAQMSGRVLDPTAYQKVYRTNPDGSVTRLDTKGGMPLVSTERPHESAVPTAFLADFISGVVDGGFITTYGSAGLYRPTLNTCASDYPESELSNLFSYERYALYKLGVELDPAQYIPEEEQGDITNNGIHYSQYGIIKPYKYTGRMRRLVQYILGIGHPAQPSLYDEVGLTSHTNLTGKLHPTTVGDRQVQFDYTLESSHGLLRDPNGVEILLWISRQYGVWAFEMPFVDGTETEAFRTTAEALASPSLTDTLVVLDEFGALPSCECPQMADLAQWQKSGCGVKLLDPSQMYDYPACSGVAKQLGWAFNYAGTEARVVGLKSVDGPHGGYSQAHYFRVMFIGVQRSRAPTTVDGSTPNLAALRAKYLVTGCSAHRSAKLRYMSEETAASIVGGAVTIDDATNAPAISGSALCSTLAYGGPSTYGEEVKVWDDLLGYCKSSWYFSSSDNPGDYSGPFHVFYTPDGTLVETRYSYGDSAQSAGPYCGLYDTRSALLGSTTRVEVGEWGLRGVAGHGVAYTTGGNPYAWSRSWHATRETHTYVTDWENGNGACFVPCGDRESIIFAKVHRTGPGTDTTSYELGTKGDKYALSLVSSSVSGAPSIPGVIHGCNVIVNGTGPFIPADSPIIYSEDPNGVDGGVWGSACDVAYDGDGTTHPDTGITGTSNPTESTATFEVVAVLGGVVRQVFSDTDEPSMIDYKYGAWWNQRSPDATDPTLTQTMRTSSCCFGPSTFAQCYDDINSGRYKVFGSLPMTCVEQEGIQLNYIGVV